MEVKTIIVDMILLTIFFQNINNYLYSYQELFVLAEEK